MKISVVFVRVNGKPEYIPTMQRWLDSYLAHPSGASHELIVVDRYTDHTDNMFDVVSPRYLRYDGGGWDCGTWQFAAQNIGTDLLVCFNSSTYITGPNWLARFRDAALRHGPGLYGPLTSYDVIPHVRTPCFVFQPEVLIGYPHTVETREDTWRFESLGWPDGTPNITQWVRASKWPTVLVTWDGTYHYQDWRKPPNIFRRGDQSNCIVRDRHCDAYEGSDHDGKLMLEKLADGR